MTAIRKFNLSLSQAKRICKEQKLVEPKKISRFKKGMINDVFLIDNEYVIKINTGHPNLPKLKKEKDLYDLLQKNKIPVPKIYAYNASRSIIKYNYLIMQYVQGNSLSDLWSSMKMNEKLEEVYKIGETLAKIHSITFRNFGEEFSNGNFKGPKSYKEFIKKYTDNLSIELRKYKVIDEDKINSIKNYYQKNKIFDINPKASLIHGNFIYDNMIVKDREIKAIVDWEWGRAMHNEEEVSTFIYRVLKEEKDLVKEFRRGYEKILKLDKFFDKRYNAYNLLYYLRVLPSVPTWKHRPDKQKEYYGEAKKLYNLVIGNDNDKENL